MSCKLRFVSIWKGSLINCLADSSAVPPTLNTVVSLTSVREAYFLWHCPFVALAAASRLSVASVFSCHISKTLPAGSQAIVTAHTCISTSITFSRAFWSKTVTTEHQMKNDFPWEGPISLRIVLKFLSTWKWETVYWFLDCFCILMSNWVQYCPLVYRGRLDCLPL